jgi:hypothetical protein
MRMNTPAATEDLARRPAEAPLSAISSLVRRVHMFSGLFLAPWMLMYALSTLIMAHRELVSSWYASRQPAMMTERELDYSRSFPANSSREQIAETILQDLGLSGTHRVSGGTDGNPLVIHRQHALTTRQITFDSSKNRILLRREQFRTSSFLERMHRRRGYNTYPLENTWGFMVDVAVVTMVFWSLSGVWLWLELKPTRLWGALALTAGLALFGLFLALI